MNDLEKTKADKKSAIRAEFYGKIDAHFNGQRGKNAGIAHAVGEIFDYLIDGKDCLKDLRYARSRLGWYDKMEKVMYECCSSIDSCGSEPCIDRIHPEWPDPPRREDYGHT